MINTPIKIANRMVGPGFPCLIVAEVSCNHRQDYDEAANIVRAAAAAGADAVKLQTFTPDTMTIDSDKSHFFLAGEEVPGSWKKQNLYQLYKSAFTPWEWHEPLKALAEQLGLIFFSTPFDETSVDFLESLQVPCYKIASYEATHIPLLEKVAATKKPIIISIGFATLEEVEQAISTLRSSGNNDIAVLHCVTTYSDAPDICGMRLATIGDISQRFKVVSGFSDNNAGIEAPILSVSAGACIIEKHLILNRQDGGHDVRFSLEPDEFQAMVRGVRRVESAMGIASYGPASQSEDQYRKLRRSVFVVQDLQEGEIFTRDNIRVIRPADGLPPAAYSELLGQRASQPIERGTPLSWDLVRP